jgi:hypothetical protein
MQYDVLRIILFSVSAERNVVPEREVYPTKVRLSAKISLTNRNVREEGICPIEKKCALLVQKKNARRIKERQLKENMPDAAQEEWRVLCGRLIRIDHPLHSRSSRIIQPIQKVFTFRWNRFHPIYQWHIKEPRSHASQRLIVIRRLIIQHFIQH